MTEPPMTEPPMTEPMPAGTYRYPNMDRVIYGPTVVRELLDAA